MAGTDWPEKMYKDERASNVFLFRLEDATMRSCTFTNGTLLWAADAAAAGSRRVKVSE